MTKKAPIEKMEPRPKIQTGPDQLELKHFSMRKDALHFDHTKDRTRQEGKADADVYTILRKHGVNLPQHHARAGTSGAVDYDYNLQQGLQHVQAAKTAWANIPNDIRKKYPTWQLLETALHEGKVVVKDGKIGFPSQVKPAVAPDKEPADPKKATDKTEPEKVPKGEQKTVT